LTLLFMCASVLRSKGLTQKQKTGSTHFQGKSGLFYIPLPSTLSNFLLFYGSYLSFISSQPLSFTVSHSFCLSPMPFAPSLNSYISALLVKNPAFNTSALLTFRLLCLSPSQLRGFYPSALITDFSLPSHRGVGIGPYGPEAEFRIPTGAASLRCVGSCCYEPEASP